VNTDGGVNRCVKFRQLFRSDEMPFDKSLQNGPNALIDNYLSQDQYRQENQEPYVRLDIASKGKLYSVQEVPLDH